MTLRQSFLLHTLKANLVWHAVCLLNALLVDVSVQSSPFDMLFGEFLLCRLEEFLRRVWSQFPGHHTNHS